MKFNLKLHSNVLGNTQQEPYYSTFCKVGTNDVNILVSGFLPQYWGFCFEREAPDVEPRARHRRMILNLSLAHGGECVNLAPRTKARACVSF